MPNTIRIVRKGADTIICGTDSEGKYLYDEECYRKDDTKELNTSELSVNPCEGCGNMKVFPETNGKPKCEAFNLKYNCDLLKAYQAEQALLKKIMEASK